MSTPGEPVGYDYSWNVGIAGHHDAHITVGFDRNQGDVSRFLVRLHYTVSNQPLRWTPIARIDHNQSPSSGHNIYKEGLHVDVSVNGQREVKLHPQHTQLPASRGVVIKKSVQYFQTYVDTFVDMYKGNITPNNPPGWPDGGEERPREFLRNNRVERDMPPQPQDDNTLTLEELSEELAAAEGMSVEEFEREAEEFEIAPPEEAEVVETSGELETS